jgi:hypothetical protein
MDPRFRGGDSTQSSPCHSRGSGNPFLSRVLAADFGRALISTVGLWHGRGGSTPRCDRTLARGRARSSIRPDTGLSRENAAALIFTGSRLSCISGKSPRCWWVGIWLRVLQEPSPSGLCVMLGLWSRLAIRNFFRACHVATHAGLTTHARDDTLRGGSCRSDHPATLPCRVGQRMCGNRGAA